jgi:hypothetical protein
MKSILWSSLRKCLKVGYLLQTHKNQEQIARLVRIIKKSSPSSEVLVSHDFTNCNLDGSVLQNLSGVHVIPGEGGRGYFSIVQGYLDAVEWLLNRQIEFDWLINISGQDYPIKPLAKIENFLAQTNYDMMVFSNTSKSSRNKATGLLEKVIHDIDSDVTIAILLDLRTPNPHRTAVVTSLRLDLI